MSTHKIMIVGKRTDGTQIESTRVSTDYEGVRYIEFVATAPFTLDTDQLCDVFRAPMFRLDYEDGIYRISTDCVEDSTNFTAMKDVTESCAKESITFLPELPDLNKNRNVIGVYQYGYYMSVVDEEQAENVMLSLGLSEIWDRLDGAYPIHSTINIDSFDNNSYAELRAAPHFIHFNRAYVIEFDE